MSEAFIDSIKDCKSDPAGLERVCNLAAALIPEEDRELFAQKVDPDVLFADQLFGGSGRGQKAVNILYDTLKTLQKWMEAHVPEHA